jgi:hypothetical protein
MPQFCIMSVAAEKRYNFIEYHFIFKIKQISKFFTVLQPNSLKINIKKINYDDRKSVIF